MVARRGPGWPPAYANRLPSGLTLGSQCCGQRVTCARRSGRRKSPSTSACSPVTTGVHLGYDYASDPPGRIRTSGGAWIGPATSSSRLRAACGGSCYAGARWVVAPGAGRWGSYQDRRIARTRTRTRGRSSRLGPRHSTPPATVSAVSFPTPRGCPSADQARTTQRHSTTPRLGLRPRAQLSRRGSQYVPCSSGPRRTLTLLVRGCKRTVW